MQCPNCGEYHFLHFDDMKVEKYVRKVGRETVYDIRSVEWTCRGCSLRFPENVMKRQPGKMVAANPEAYEKGVRSFRLNAWISPWRSWDSIAEEFFYSYKDPLKLQVVYNTLFGEAWEDRGELEGEKAMLARREEYKAEVPSDAYVLTCGVDVQDNRLEYEVVGHGHSGETWGIKTGFIMGKPDDPATWTRLDDVIDKAYNHGSGKKLTVSATFVDTGGHYTQEVYEACKARSLKRVYAIEGRGGDGIPYTSPPTQVPIRESKKVKCWLYSIGVDAGKANIMGSLRVKEPGPKYCHFPIGEAKGYDSRYFNGLLSERLVPSRTKSSNKWTWEKLPGHAHNEALDCRNYAMAAFRVLDVDMDAYEQRFKEQPGNVKPQQRPVQQQKRRRNAIDKAYNDW